ncbi:conjugative transposon protein TraK [Hymenobacter qilianensis]|uniref:Conjugative transposon protein TraK n=2 Tax=Hymenobacter qilianensis TaxID=1385715 RepID=A0ACB5PX67_9BACT|nr:conjugative transposon protein TraK [Hymenobacter qilianensis]QNP54427.1 conjugative transposon protein TraK [Hymenobacter qilianensis]GGF80504.1 conjugative transposon protein TraK [Hymenobacter qilianensis]
MFRSLKNIDSAYQQTKTLALLFMLLCFSVSAYAIYAARQTALEAQGRIYVLDQGSLLAAVSHNVKDNRPVEAKDHVKRFHELFFTLDPDPKAIEYNVKQALFLADASAQRAYANLRESSYYNNLIQANISQDIRVDSVALQTSVYPYYVRCYAQQRIIRASTVTTRRFVSECYLRDVSRSANNPHGFLMERWRAVENIDLRTERR